MWKRSGSVLSFRCCNAWRGQPGLPTSIYFHRRGEIRIGSEHTTGDHVLRSAAAVHMAAEKVTVPLHLWVTLHYRAIIVSRLLSLIYIYVLYSVQIVPISSKLFLQFFFDEQLFEILRGNFGFGFQNQSLYTIRLLLLRSFRFLSPRGN